MFRYVEGKIFARTGTISSDQIGLALTDFLGIQESIKRDASTMESIAKVLSSTDITKIK